MLIAHISDAHISEPGKKTYGNAPMAENLTLCVADINAQLRKPELVLLSGDVTNDFNEQQAQHAKDILDQLNCPYYVVPGNHDDRDVIRQVFGGAACPSTGTGFINYAIENHRLRLIGLDTLSVGASAGAFCAERADWLRSCLEQGGGKPTLLFMHHPPMKVGVPETDTDVFQGAEHLAAVVRDFPNIERILCGHIHLAVHCEWQGTIVSTAPSLGMQIRLDLTQKNPSEYLLGAPGYLLHHILPDGRVISHSVQVDNAPGPFAFEHPTDG